MKKIFLSQYITNRDIHTSEIQLAINVAADANAQLVVESGVYKTGTLFLKNNSNIFLEEGAVLFGSDDINDYPDNPASFIDAVGDVRGKTLILAYECENIRISGYGTICGNGEVFNKSHPDYSIRPFLFRIVESKNILLSNVSLTQSAAWCLHVNNSENVDIDGIKIHNRANENNDGIDIDASSYVTIKNCDINSGDDGICLKATTEKPCMYIDVKNCRISSGWGGFKIGTESVGDIAHVNISDCFFYDVEGCGIKIVPVDGANVFDIKIINNKMERTTGPIFIALGERLRKYAGIGRNTYSTLKDIVIDGLVADSIRAKERGIYFGGVWGNAIGGVIVSGTKNNNIENLIMKNMQLDLPGGETTYPDASNVPEMGEKYPEFHLFDPVPAKGIYIRQANNIELSNITMKFKENDVRELMYFDEVANVTCNNVR